MILRSPDPVPRETGGAPDPEPGPQNPPAPAPTPIPAPGGHPAARAALEGGRTEAEIALRDELQKEKSAHATTAEDKKKREQRINELEDEIRRLKTPPSDPKPKKRDRVSLTLFRLRD